MPVATSLKTVRLMSPRQRQADAEGGHSLLSERLAIIFQTVERRTRPTSLATTLSNLPDWGAGYR